MFYIFNIIIFDILCILTDNDNEQSFFSVRKRISNNDFMTVLCNGDIPEYYFSGYGKPFWEQRVPAEMALAHREFFQVTHITYIINDLEHSTIFILVSVNKMTNNSLIR